MKTRKLGNTGWKVPLFSLGGQSALEQEGPKSTPASIEIVHRFLELGGNYLDTSPEYTTRKPVRMSENNLGKALKDVPRDSYYLATKTEERTEEKAWRDINESVEALGTAPDCIQVHHLDTKTEVNQVFGKNGAMKALLRAQDQRLTRFLGITGHSDPNVLMYALSKHKFDTVLGAMNVADIHMGNTSFQKELIPHCVKNNIGFIAMKVCSRGAMFNFVESMEDILRYVWSFPISTSIIGINNISQLERNMELAENFRPLSEYKKQKLEEKTEEKAKNIMFFNKKGDDRLWRFYDRGSETPHFVV